MIRIYGSSDDLVEIEGYVTDKIPCYDSYVRFWFDDGAIVQISYPKNDKAIWKICVERTGSKPYVLDECNDENADLYSDVYLTEANILKHKTIRRY